MSYRKLLAPVVQLVWGFFDDDGRLLGKEVDPPTEVFYPYGRSLDDYVAARQKQASAPNEQK